MNDFPFLGKTIQGLFGKNQFSIHHHLKNPSRRGEQLNFDTENFSQFLPQTGGTRLIISLCTIFYGYLH
jgi:hypothetical protein